MKWLALLPIIAALAFLVRASLRRGAGTRAPQLLALLALLAAAAVLLALPSVSASETVVFVYDPGGGRKLLHDQLRAAFEGHWLSRQDAVVVSTASDDVHDRRWAPLDESFDPDVEGARASSFLAAMDAAFRRHEERGWLQQLLDSFLLRSRRIVVVVTNRGFWEAQRQELRADDLARRAAALGVTIDVLERTSTAVPPSEQPAVLRIVPLQRVVASNRRWAHGSFRLELESALFANDRAPTRLDVRCEIDPGLRADGSSLTTRVPPDSTQRGVATTEIDLAGFSPATEYGPGFHLLRCRVEAEVRAGTASAEASTFFLAGMHRTYFVAGTAGRFHLPEAVPLPDPSPDERTALLHAWHRVPPGRWAQSVVFADSDYFSEDTFCEVLDTQRKKQITPYLLVLHDVTDEALVRCASTLSAAIADGMNVLVAGAPREATARALAFLPVFASGPGPDSAWTHLRRPRVTVLRDASRIGRIRYAPEPSLTPNPKLEKLEFGPDIQKAITEPLVAAVASANAGSGDVPWVLYQEDTFDPPLAPNQIQDTAAMWAASQLQARLARMRERTQRPSARQLAVNDVVLVLTYDVSQSPQSVDEVARALREGATFIIAVVRSPYSKAVSLSATSGALDLAGWKAKVIQRARSLGEGFPFGADDAIRRLHVEDLDVSLDAENARGAAAKLGSRIAALVEPRLRPDAQVFAPHRIGRFIDERIGFVTADRASRTELSHQPAELFRAGPLVFQQLAVLPHSALQLVTIASVASNPKLEDGGDGLSVAVGGVHGAGQVTVLGYSPFEGALERSPFKTRWSNDARTRIFAPGGPTADWWGAQRIIDLSGLSSTLEPSASDTPKVTSARVIDAKGRLAFEVLQRIERGRAVVDPELAACVLGPGPDPFNAPCTPVRQTKMVLLDAKPDQQKLVYGVSPTMIDALCDRAPGCAAVIGGSRLFLENPLRQGGNRRVDAISNLSALSAMVALAQQTGGERLVLGRKLRAPEVATRIPAALAVVFALAALWMMRVVRRWLQMRAASREVAGDVAAALQESAAGVVAQAGESLGRPVTIRRAGAFAGFRPFEPGDRLDSVPMDDVVLLTSGASALVPRVAQRIDERARRVVIIVNVGNSMRHPALRSTLPSKLVAAAAICELVAEIAWRGRAEVELHATGLAGGPTMMGTFMASPGEGEVTRLVCGLAHERAVWNPPALRPELDELAAVVYVSDFLNDDLERLQAWATELEDDGGGFGAIHVFSRTELKLLDFGLSPSGRVICERSEWTHHDLEAAHSRFVDMLAATFERFRGGMEVVEAGRTASDLLEELRESPLLEMLR